MIDELPRDGAEVLLLNLLRLRDPDLRYQVVCLVQGGVLQPEFEAIGVPVTVLGRRGRFDPGLVWRLARWLRREKAEIVHTHLFTADTYGRVAARLAGVRAVFSTSHSIRPHGSSRFRRKISGFLAHATTAVIACSEEVAHALVLNDHLAPTRVRCIPNGIDLHKFGSASGEGVREEFGITANRRLLGVIGRLHPAKGHEFLFRALAALPEKRRRELACLIVGTGELESQLRTQCHELGLDDCLIFTGGRSDVPRLVAALDVMIMPSQFEGLPIALLEAMASGRPVLCTRVGGIPDVVRNGDNGILLDYGDVAALCAAIEQLLDDPKATARLGHEARRSVVGRFDITRTAAAYNCLHREALGMSAVNTATLDGSK